MDTNFSWEYEFILLTTIIYFYIISQQYDYFKHNFLLRVLETEIVVVEGHFSTVPSILLFLWVLLKDFETFHRILLFQKYILLFQLLD